MDRMPKEYKILVYILGIGLSYYIVFAYNLYLRFKIVESLLTKYLLAILILFFMIASIPFVLLIKKSPNSTKVAKNIMIFLISLNLLFLLSMLFFKESASFIALFNVGAFTPYLAMGIARLSPDRAALMSILILPWQIYTLYLINHRETKDYIKSKEYPPVNTQLYTLGILTLLFVTIAFLSLLYGL
ncbi:MAG: hypothetical protein K6343_00485 [Caldisericaceae bacterium]